MQSAASKMNPSAAKTAVTPESRLHAVPESIFQQCAQNAVKKQRFPLNPKPTDRFIAANAMQKFVNSKLTDFFERIHKVIIKHPAP